MKVSKWGNSLAVRLPADIVEKLGVKEGDEIIARQGLAEDTVTFERKKTLEEMWAAVDEIRKRVKWPTDYKFDRSEIYDSEEKYYADK